jgi:hypothetical protein
LTGIFELQYLRLKTKTCIHVYSRGKMAYSHGEIIPKVLPKKIPLPFQVAVKAERLALLIGTS